MTSFKDAGLEYITLQAENFLENNLLESLDEEVLEELDAVVRENQLARYPFARSGRAELLLHEQYPELAQDMEEERQRRVREMAFKANLKEEERKLSSSLKGKFGSLEEFTPASPSMDRQGGKAKEMRNEPFSPDLRPKSTQADLMFDMDDDEGPIDSPSVRPKRISEAKQSELDQITPLAESYRDEKPASVGRTPLASSLVGTVPGSPSLASRPASMVPGKAGGKPWASAALPTSKLDLREIMNEASPGTSALSAGLAAQKAKEAAAAKPQQAKMSQKERKRQQQLQAEQAAKAALAPPVKMAWDKSSKDAAPWNTVSSRSKPSPKTTSTETLAPAPVPTPKPLVVAETSSAPISRRTQSPDTRHSGQSRTPTTTSAPPGRPPLKSTGASSSTSTFAVDDPTKPITPHSRSYIKPASKSEPTLGLSMADIIDQEKRSREKVREAVAKRSLMEIQQEQAFQEWWDEESRRTQEEEAKRTREREEAGSSRTVAGRGRRGRGGKARGGGGGGSGSAAAGPDSREEATPQQQQQSQQRDGGRGGRGRGRGRGRAAARAST